MSQSARKHLSDLRGATRLAVEATEGVTYLVEAMHATIAQVPGIVGPAPAPQTRGITGLVYRSIRGVTRLVGGGLDQSLAALTPLLGAGPPSVQREAVIATLNGVLGDYLAASGNPLAIDMALRQGGVPLVLQREALAAALPQAGGRVLVLAHGLCMNDRTWCWQGHDHGAALAAELGVTPVYLHYNSGLHVSINGQGMAALMEALIAAWPVPVSDLTILGYSMGGLVARSAHHAAIAAGHAWPAYLKRQCFLGTPHLGAPLERGGNGIDLLLGVSPYSAPFARLGKIRSAGITDLRHGSLLEQDWLGRDRFEHAPTHPTTVPLPAGVEHFAIAGTTGFASGDLSDVLLGDGLVPVASALGQHRDPARRLELPPDHTWISYATNHLDLLSRPAVYTQLREWLA